MADTRHVASPVGIFKGLIQHKDLIFALVKRDFIGRYQGSIMGVAWSLFNPLLMLAIYTFVFSVAFKARWGTAEESKIAFALVLFSGMIVHGFFAECLTRAPGLITSNPNYVKKVVFPIEALAWMAVSSALLHFFVSFGVLVVFCLIAGATIHAGVLLLPIVLLPLLMLTLGLTWLLAALGVYVRDLEHSIGMIATIALFLAPVFYPIEMLPEIYRKLLVWNPITLPIQQLRDVMLWGRPLQLGPWTVSFIVSAAIFFFGYWWFQKTRKGFADVL